MNVKCTHDGYIPKLSATPSSTKGLVFGNILFGGLIGVVIDMGTGSAFDYPDILTLELQPTMSARLDGAPTS